MLPALGASALDRFLQKRPPPSKLQQLNILKEARNDPMKNRKKLDALLERRPSMDELKRRNIVKTGTTSEFHARQESLEALLGNLLLKTASNAPNSTHQREPSSQLSAFLRNRSNPSELLQNAQATLERFVDAEQLREETPKGPMQHRDKLGALLERRPSMDALKRRNIVRTTNKIGFSERKASLEALLQNLLVQTESTKFVVSPPANARDATSQLSEFLAHRDDKADKDDDVLPSVVAAPSAPSAAPKRKHHRGLSRFNGNATPLRPTTTTAEASGRLQKLLAQRPSPEALMSQNILKTTPNEMATHVKRRQLLSDLLQKRPALNELTQLGIIEEGAPTLESIEAVPLVVKRPHLIPNEPLENDAPSGDEADYTQVVFTWGAGLHGQCGLGNTRNQPFPQLVRELLAFNVLQISVGAQHSMALTSTGQAFAWGSNAHGQLALGDLDPRKSPCSIHVSKSPLCNGNVKFVSCGLFNSALIGGTTTTTTPSITSSCMWFSERRALPLRQGQRWLSRNRRHQDGRDASTTRRRHERRRGGIGRLGRRPLRRHCRFDSHRYRTNSLIASTQTTATCGAGARARKDSSGMDRSRTRPHPCFMRPASSGRASAAAETTAWRSDVGRWMSSALRSRCRP